MAHVIVTDIYWDVNLQDFLKSLEAAGGPHIQGYKAEGPGGGNPMLTLEFNSEDQARKFLADNGLE